MDTENPKTSIGSAISRRRFLGALGAAGGVAALGVAGVAAAADDDNEPKGSGRIDFYGKRQAGITTPAQDRLHIAAFDITSDKRADVQQLLKTWTDAAALLCAGKPIGAVDGAGEAPPEDTAEQLGLQSSRLTITFGFGPGLFEKNGVDRFGLAAKRPAGFEQLPSFKGDAIDPAISEGDLVVQACGDDPQVLFHAVHNLTRLARGTATMRWAQFGFGRTSSTTSAQKTPRNLMGSIDGTNNIKSEDDKALDEFVWVGNGDGQPWLAGGSYMVTRRIRMLLEVWDRSSLHDQEETIGRHKISGAPLGKKHEHDALDFAERDSEGNLVIPANAHARLANPHSNNGIRMLRRGYSFTDGIDQSTGQLDAGLFFISFQRSIVKQFVPVQTQLASSDKLNDYIKHMSSAVFAVPPGVKKGDYIGRSLFEG